MTVLQKLHSGRSWRRGLAWASLTLLLAATPAERFDKLAERHPDKAVVKGEAWLEKHGGEEGAAEVRKVVLQAAFDVAGQTDTVAAWQSYIATYGSRRWPEVRPAIRAARVREEAAAWRDALAESPKVAVWRTFWETYPDGAHYGEARELEARLAHDQATVAADVARWQAWRAAYVTWPEAKKLVPSARKAEMTLAFDAATSADASGVWAAWLEQYGEWPDAPEIVQKAQDAEFGSAEREAREAGTAEAWRALQERFSGRRGAKGLLVRARTEERQAALTVAMAAGSFDALNGWSHRYGADPVQADIAVRAAETYGPLLLAAPFVLADHLAFRAWAPAEPWHAQVDARLADACLDALLADPVGWHAPDWGGCGPSMPYIAGMPERAGRRVQALKRAATADGTVQAGSRLAQLIGDDPTRKGSVSHTTGTRWWSAVVDGNLQPVDFLTHFPDHPRAVDAEQRIQAQVQQQLARNTWPRAELAYSKSAGSGRTELVFDVKDCEGRRISGLPESAFTVWDEGAAHRTASFQSLEDDRPLVMTVAIDLSGSMATEQAAVREAAAQLARTMEYRGRDLRIGLIGFAEKLPVHQQPRRGIDPFLAGLRNLPSTDAGGFGEDSAGALAQGAADLAALKGERALLLLSDEPLQVHELGRKKLGLKTTQCDLMRSLGQCLVACSNRIDCQVGCFTGSGSYLAQAMSGCLEDARRSYNPKGQCLREGIQALDRDLMRCGSELDHDELPTRLASYLNQRKVRPFVLVSGDTDGAYRKLVEATGGRFVPVPQDAREVEPYTRALLDVADQLSKQYRIVVDGKLTGNPLIAVGDAWSWVPEPGGANARSAVGVERIVHDTATWGGAPLRSRALEFRSPLAVSLAVAEDGTITRRVAGGAARTVVEGGFEERVLTATPGRAGIPRVCTEGIEAVLCSEDLGRTWSTVGRADGSVPLSLSTSSGGQVVGQMGDDTLVLARVVNRDIPSSAVYFDVDSATPKTDDGGFLRVVAERLAADPGLQVRVEGHSDSTGEDAYNLDLSQRRAAAVREALLAMGVEAGRVQGHGFGERFPVRTGSSEAALARNRRVEIVLLEPVTARPQSTCGAQETAVLDAAGPPPVPPEVQRLTVLGETHLDAVDATLTYGLGRARTECPDPRGMAAAWMEVRVTFDGKGTATSVESTGGPGVSASTSACWTDSLEQMGWPTHTGGGAGGALFVLDWL